LDECSNRQDVTAAAHTIDQLLKTDPETRGEGRLGETRILIVRPLVVYFEVVRLTA